MQNLRNKKNADIQNHIFMAKVASANSPTNGRAGMLLLKQGNKINKGHHVSCWDECESDLGM